MTVSPNIFRLTGYTEAEALAPGWWLRSIHPEDRAAAQAALAHLLEQGRVACEYRFRHASGHYLWIYDERLLSGGPGDEGFAVVGSWTDLTQRRQAEENLRASEARFRLAVEEASIPIIIHAEDGEVLSLSRAWSEITGYHPEEIRTVANWTEKAYGDDKERVRFLIKELYSLERRRDEGEFRIRTRDGGERIWRFSSVGLGRLPDGRRIASSMAADVTDLRLALSAAEESEERLRLALEAAQVGIWDLDVRTGEARVSPEYATMLGYDPSRFQESHQAWLERIHPDDREGVQRIYQDYIAGRLPEYRAEFRQHTAEGSWRWTLLMGRAVERDPSGAPTRLMGTHTDITERKRGEASLALQTRRAEALLELPRDAEFLGPTDLLQRGQNLAQELTASSLSFLQFVGAGTESLEATLEAWTPDVPVPLKSALPASLESVSQPVLENECQAPGLTRFLTVPVLEHGQVVMLAGVANKPEEYQSQDVETLQLVASELWRVVQHQRSGEQIRKLSQAVEQSPNSVVITNLAAEIEYVNEAFVRASGYSRAEVLGKNPRVLQSGRTAPSVYVDLWSTLSRGETWQGEFCNRRKDGTVYVEFARITPIHQPDGPITHYVGVKEDITERKRIGEELERHRHHLEELVDTRTAELAEARARAETANRSKSVFLANMSHEIRTPLNAIMGLTHLLRRSGATPDQGRRLDEIESAGRHLLSIINDVLDRSKIEAGRLDLEDTDFSVLALLEQVRSLVAASAEAKGVRLEIDSQGLPAWLRGDPTRLRQALLNFAGNAVKFTERGRIDLRARLQEQREDRLVVRFEVQDTGVGIAAAKLPELFQDFEQADASTTRRYGGTGLGLAITRRLAELMGGEAGAQSEPGVGSTFWFTALLAAGVEVAQVSDGQSGEAQVRGHHSGARVLLAEDNRINREVAVELLEGAGLQVELAEDGSQAVERARQATYALILMDIQMPELDGLEAARAIRSLPGYQKVPIVAMTANAFEEDRRACREAGMDDFISKPFEPHALYAKLDRWLSVGSGPALTSVQPALALDPLSRLSGLDTARGLASLRGNSTRYLKLLSNFLESSGTDLESLQTGDLPGIIRLAHGLKGAAGSLGADRAAELAASLESRARQGVADDSLVEELRREVARLQAALPAAAGEGVKSRPPDPEARSRVLKELERLLGEGDTAALALLEDHRPLLESILGEEFIRHLEVFDFESALALVRRDLECDPQKVPHSPARKSGA